MKPHERWAIYPLLLFSLLASVIAICRTCPRAVTQQDLGLDYMGIIVGILSLLIGLLVGWQIYNAVTINKKIDKIDEIANRIVEEKIKDYDHNVEAVIKQLYGIVLFGEHRNKDALNSFMEALEEANKSSHKEPIKGILSFIKGMEEEQRRVNPIPIETSNRYIGILQNLNIDNANEYINYIRSLEEKVKNENRT